MHALNILADTALRDKPVGGLTIFDLFLIIFTIVWSLGAIGVIFATGSPWEPRARSVVNVLLVIIVGMLVFVAVSRHLPK
jgi:hypothetical protein